jgi:hypothetical protein
MINSTHPQYDKMLPSWDKCRRTYGGEEDVKAAGQLYLPKLGSQKTESYNAYKKRAYFFNGVAKTIDGMVGTSMRVDPVINGVPKELLKDITGTGISVIDFISYLLTEQLLMGQQGVMVDHNGERPYLSGFKAEQIVNWMDDRIILAEQYLVADDKDEYKQKFETQYRELVLDDSGAYSVYLWRKVKSSGGVMEQWGIVETYSPSIKGSKFTNIPFVKSSVDGLNLSTEKPPLLPLVDMNLSHYRSSADLEHGRHFTSLPTPYIIGVKDAGTIQLGAETAWVIPNEKAQVGFLEFTGQGLQSLEEAITQKGQMMAALGAQLISGQRKGVESFEALALKQNAEMSHLMAAVKRTEGLITNALQLLVDWTNEPTEVTVKLNTVFGADDEDDLIDSRAGKDRKQKQKDQKKEGEKDVI